MKETVCFILLVAFVVTVCCVSIENDLEMQQVIARQKAMEAGCYNRNRIAPNGKQGLTDTNMRWPKGIVYYAWDKQANWTSDEKKTIQTGMKLITSTTCIRFRQRTTQKNYVRIQTRKTGCYATLGAMKQGMQEVNLERPGCIQKGTVAHELLHSLGIDHEQCRTDRDDYIEVHYENIKADLVHNFDINNNTDTYDLPYDFDSIMHYFRTAFTKNGQPTMVSKVPGQEVSEYGNYEKLTEKDISLVKKMYNCA